MPSVRTLELAVVVIALHVLALYAIQSGLARRVLDAGLAQTIVAQLVEPDPLPAAPAPPPPKPQAAPPQPVRIVRPAPKLVAAPVPPAPSVETLPPRPEAETAVPEPPTAVAVPAQPAAAPAPAIPPVAAAFPAAEAGAPRAAPSAPRAVALGEIECRTPEPRYPLASRRLGEQGVVRVRLVIDESGAVAHTELAASSGYERLDKVALEAARNTRCKPYLHDGREVRVTAVRPFAFALD